MKPIMEKNFWSGKYFSFIIYLLWSLGRVCVKREKPFGSVFIVFVQPMYLAFYACRLIQCGNGFQSGSKTTTNESPTIRDADHPYMFRTECLNSTMTRMEKNSKQLWIFRAINSIVKASREDLNTISIAFCIINIFSSSPFDDDVLET